MAGIGAGAPLRSAEAETAPEAGKVNNARSVEKNANKSPGEITENAERA